MKQVLAYIEYTWTFSLYTNMIHVVKSMIDYARIAPKRRGNMELTGFRFHV